MPGRLSVSVAATIGLLLCLDGPAGANDADDAIGRLGVRAREQAATRDAERLVKTLAEIAGLLDDATWEGVSAAREVAVYLAARKGDERGQGGHPASISDAGKTPRSAQASPVPASPKPAEAAPLRSPPASAPAAVVVPVALPEVPQARVSLVALLRRRGDAALDMGDISGARRFYQRGAEAGCATCAEALARTYDAEHLRRMGAVGIRPDPAQAEAWRSRARQLGPADAPH